MMARLFYQYWQRSQLTRGEISLAGVFGVLVLITAYMLYPGVFDHFFHYLFSSFQNIVHKSQTHQNNNPLDITHSATTHSATSGAHLHHSHH
jgi:hypothetical protein